MVQSDETHGEREVAETVSLTDNHFKLCSDIDI
jgi:hypothetical protein